ncbi:MAG: dTDP-4-dehydrorhamnose 3,5-epimerase family protein [Oceanospirillaceae bacterium]|nr:dTDP-4-dehydrorhamnose 3,5-epimerase family protein [Oceanospirillaceae bacterium]
MVDGVVVTPLRVISLDKGDVMHCIKSSDASFVGFGEAYFSIVNYGQVKGWKKHTEMTMNIVVPEGDVQFVIYDDRETSSTYQRFFSIILGKSNYCRLTVPSGLWVAFKGLGSATNLLMNFADIEHQPEEAITRPVDSILFNWGNDE